MPLDRPLKTACLVVLAACLGGAVPAGAQIAASGRTLTVTTTNAVATFSGADLVGFVNRPATPHWFVLTSTSGYTAPLTYQWGSTGDVPLTRR